MPNAVPLGNHNTIPNDKNCWYSRAPGTLICSNGFQITYCVCSLTDVGVCVVPAEGIILVHVQLGGLQHTKPMSHQKGRHKATSRFGHSVTSQHVMQPKGQLSCSQHPSTKSKSKVLINYSSGLLLVPSLTHPAGGSPTVGYPLLLIRSTATPRHIVPGGTVFFPVPSFNSCGPK